MSKVLIVDDDFAFRSLLSSLVEGDGHEVTQAADGSQALDIIRNRSKTSNGGQPPFDLVMSDFNMEIMGGFELVRAIRSEEGMSQSPIIMITGTTKDIRQVIEVERVKFLKKPCPNRDILQAVRDSLLNRPPSANGGSVSGLGKPLAGGQGKAKPPPPPAPKGNVGPGRTLPAGGKDAQPMRGPEPDPGGQGFSLDPFFIQSRHVDIPPAPVVPPSEKKQLPEKQSPEKQPPRKQAAAAPPPAPASASAQSQESSAIELGNQQLAMLGAKVISSGGVKEEEEEDSATQELAGDSSLSQLVQLVNGILVEAINRRASDIHIEPQRDALHVRMRIDGALQEALRLPLAIKHNVAARIKVVANLNLAEKRLPQDGRFSMRMEGRPHVEFRVSTMPSQFGETVVMRILQRERVTTRLSDIFQRERDLSTVQHALMAPTGLILVTGPTGGGKSTTLYTMLETINKPNRKIITVEDPIEREIPGITQVAVNSHIDLTFEKVLRSCLRQDPNVLMVGEIRDLETADISLKAAMTGHLVLSTLHTNQAHMAVYRLVTMGLKPFLVTASLRLVIAQRLLRLLCPHCKVKRPPAEDEVKTLTKQERDMLVDVYAPKGCSRCQDIGYLGRKAVLEVMPVQSHAIRQLIMELNNPDAIFEWAKSEGMVTLRQSALELVAKGLTSLEEAFTIYFID